MAARFSPGACEAKRSHLVRDVASHVQNVCSAGRSGRALGGCITGRGVGEREARGAGSLRGFCRQAFLSWSGDLELCIENDSLNFAYRTLVLYRCP